ncbi:MAG: family 43 glycosylhydrolase [Roseburia sp.]|nr:family 43 glycosylhydrolase [Roseburia sp.]
MNKKMKKVLSAVLAAAMMISLSPTALQGSKTVQAAETDVKEVDLSKFDIQQESDGRPEYDETTGTIKAKDVVQFIVTLPEQVNTGDTVKVTIEGKNNGTAGFRFWLSDKGFNNLSEIIKSTDEGISTGEFSLTKELTSTGAATEILIKGSSYGVNLDDIEITSIKVEYGAQSTAREPKNPYKPETEQAYDTTDLTLTKSFRDYNTKGSRESVNSMLVAQRFIADPTTIEYNGRLYVYGTTDEIGFDGKANVKDNEYDTHTLSCISTDDMVNWKDEGQIDVTKLTTYATKSWAPSIVSKEVDGTTKFYIYYTTGGDGIAVLEADSPTGPWRDPLGKRIIDRSLPTCSEAEVPWLFDPGVFIDDDGSAYIYFGGNNEGSNAGRVCKLNDDMISLDTDTMTTLDPYYYFEDNEINKFGDTYYYSYSTNWSSDLANDKDEYTGQACIAYYTADNPYMKNWTYHGTVFPNPGGAYDHVYNNHHHMFTFKGEAYIAYHTTYLERALYGTKQGYRNLHIDRLTINEEDKTLSAEGTYAGVGAAGKEDAYLTNPANNMSDNGGVTTAYSASQNQMVLSEIHTGDWTKVSGVDFSGTGAKGVQVSVASTTDQGSIEVYLDGKPGDETSKKIATLPVSSTGDDVYKEVSATLDETVTGVHDLYFVFRGTGYTVSNWKFLTTNSPSGQDPATVPTAAPSEVPSATTTAPAITPTAAPDINEDNVTALKRVKSLKATNKKAKKVSLKWKKVSGATGYEVQYGTNKKFKKAKKVKNIKKANVTIKGLSKKKTYYFRVRAFKTVNGKKVYGTWSKKVSVKIKK